MQWQHSDVAKELAESENEKRESTRFLGGLAVVDLWICDTGVLICQYDKNPEDYVSYWPADAVWLHVKGEIGPDATVAEYAIDKHRPTVWFGSGYALDLHDPKLIATYLLCFAPHVLSDTVREEIYNSKGETDGT